jgi:hypothetical protein
MILHKNSTGGIPVAWHFEDLKIIDINVYLHINPVGFQVINTPTLTLPHPGGGNLGASQYPPSPGGRGLGGGG